MSLEQGEVVAFETNLERSSCCKQSGATVVVAVGVNCWRVLGLHLYVVHKLLVPVLQHKFHRVKLAGK